MKLTRVISSLMGLNYRQGKKKNILLFSSRRGASTLLRQILACDRGTREVDQPFDLFKPDTLEGRIKKRFLPDMFLSQFIHLTEPDQEKVRHFIHQLLTGGLPSLGFVGNPSWPFKADRTVLKICCALPLVDWLYENFDVYVVYLLRHPIAQAMSVMRHSWGVTGEAYLKNSFFVESYLRADQLAYARHVQESGTYFEKVILNWCLENLFPLKYSKSPKITITYEEIVVNSEGMINLLSQKLELTDRIRMQNILTRPSFSSNLIEDEKRNKAIMDGAKDFLLRRWMNEIDSNHVKQAQNIFDSFDIREYRADSIMPAASLLHSDSATDPP